MKHIFLPQAAGAQEAQGTPSQNCLSLGVASMSASAAAADSVWPQGTEAGPFRAVGSALEVIPRTLAQNCGANVIRTLTKLRAKHAEQADCTFGIDGNTGLLFQHQTR